jgi:hypothetical protein
MALLTPARNLTEAILDSGIQNTNFFNGRILNAGDLQTDQDANRQQHEQLALAIGAGIVRGLWVELVSAGSGTTAPIVSVTQGLALNANGQAVALPLDVQVALTRVTTPLPVDAGLFADCAPPTATTVPLQAGVYILVAAPASGYSGRAPMYSFGDISSATGCGSRYAVEGLRFRLVQLDITKLTRLSQATRDAIAQLMTKTDAASLSQLRNWIAHICFGTEEVAGFLVDPFPPTKKQSPYLTYGAIDALMASGDLTTGDLTTGDVPLALLYWTTAGVQFLDRWSVRRRVVPPPSTATWPLPFSARRCAQAEAAFLQFQEQIDDTVRVGSGQGDLLAVTASTYFRYLPAVGLLPLAGTQLTGFSLTEFFANQTCRGPLFTRNANFSGLFYYSLPYAPIDTSTKELIWLYLTPGNSRSANQPGGPAPYVIFASGYIPYQGDSRFDASQWNFSDYSLTAAATAASSAQEFPS